MRGTAVHLPTQVEWVLWDGSNYAEVAEFVREGNGGGAVSLSPRADGVVELVLHTRQGDRWPKIGDRIVRGTTMELYVITPNVWGRTYARSYEELVTYDVARAAYYAAATASQDRDPIAYVRDALMLALRTKEEGT